RGGEEPLQVAHAARHPHLVAQRTQDVIGGEQAEEVRERPEERAQLLRPHRHEAGEEVQGLSCSAWRSSGAVSTRPETAEPRSNAFDSARDPAATASKPASLTSCMPTFSATGSSAATGIAMRGA